MAWKESRVSGDRRFYRRAVNVSGSQPIRGWVAQILSVMQLAIVGLSHKTAPVEVRERLAFNSEALRTALSSLVQKESISEAMILSTCNRVEVVAEGPDDRLVRDFICEYHKVQTDVVAKHLYSFKNTDAIRHMFRVTSSLDSMMVGEPQILGQVKEAFP